MEKRQKNVAGRMWWLAGAFLLLSCRPAYQLTEVEGGRVAMTETFDRVPQDEAAVAIVQSYKAKVDSVMSPVIGRSKMEMDVDRPESLLSNFVADVLLRAGSNYIGHPVDFAVINVGGLRTSLPEGDVTYGDVYEILPFQNTLCILEMKGEAVQALFRQMAAVGGEGLSGARRRDARFQGSRPACLPGRHDHPPDCGGLHQGMRRAGRGVGFEARRADSRGGIRRREENDE